MKNRGFEIVRDFRNKDLKLPIRSTKYAAGYDLFCAEDTIIPSFHNGVLPVLVATGVKAYMQNDEVLYIYNRSSNPKKRGLVLANGVGVIDKDYYGNSSNDGHIMILFYNLQAKDVIIKKGEAIAQGVFQKYLLTDEDFGEEKIRVGGFGSTDAKEE